MNFAKALAKLAIILVIIFVAILLINMFYPNPYTASIFTFITVTAPAYIMSKIEWIMISIGGITALAGGAIKSINKTKDDAATKVTQAQEEANQAKSLASDQFGEVTKLQEEKKALQDQLTGMQKTRTEAEQLVSQQQAEIVILKREKQEYKELAEKKIGGTVEVYK